jgi:NAD(P)H-binding
LVNHSIYDDKDIQERIVRRSKLDWVIVRPVILTSGPKTKAYRALVDPRDWTCGFISRADVADFLVKQIDNDAFLHTANLRQARPQPNANVCFHKFILAGRIAVAGGGTLHRDVMCGRLYLQADSR